MGNLNRYTFPVISGLILIPLMMAGARTSVSEMSYSSTELPAVNVQGQQNHSMELAPSREIASEQSPADMRKQILSAVKKSLPKEHREFAFEIARTVITEANHHMMDPFFLLAVIKTESHFNLKALGRHGEIGLMQILPETAKWIAPQAGIEVSDLNLEDPKTNIRIGATYFASLRKSFGGYGARYIGAYNMGSKNVRRLMAMNMDPEVYPGKVLKNYRSFYNTLTDSTINGKSTDKVVKPNSRSKKLQTRATVNKCKKTSCPADQRQPLMPTWALS